MCGFGGMAIANGGRMSEHDLGIHLLRMTQLLHHRGPDASGVWIDPNARAGLAHTRLSIRDLSPAGAQPFTSRDGTWVISYNGEIYNAREVADALLAEGHPGFRGHSDTEVLADAIAAWGVRAAVERCAGMFAFAAVNAVDGTLAIVRDRVGIKPAVWAWMGDCLAFGSDTRVWRGVPGEPTRVDPEALDRYLRVGRVTGSRGLLQGVHKVEPGTIAEWNVRSLARGDEPKITRYWSAGTALAAASRGPFTGSDQAVLDSVEGTLTQCVADHLVSDVPVGAFLSGGIDSSLVVALLRRGAGVPVRTFTIGFTDADHDESAHAAHIARHLGTDHHEYRVQPDDALAALDTLVDAWDEPFADVSAIPTYIVSRMARADVTVVLTGDGGDESFAGYDRYVWLPRVTRLRKQLGAPGRTLVSAALQAMARPAAARAFAFTHPVLPSGLRIRQIDRKAARMAAALGAPTSRAVHDATLESWSRRQQLVPGVGPSGASGDSGAGTGGAGGAGANASSDESPASELRGYMLTDLQNYLVDDILTKLDRATMAVSLEGRVPFLDHRVIEMAMRLPDHMLVRKGTAKWVLRELLARHVPREMFERPKSGFTIPVGAWLRGPLRSWADAHFTHDRLVEAGVEPEPFLQAWREHVAGSADRSAALWALLMYLRWLEKHELYRPGARGE